MEKSAEEQSQDSSGDKEDVSLCQDNMLSMVLHNSNLILIEDLWFW